MKSPTCNFTTQLFARRWFAARASLVLCLTLFGVLSALADEAPQAVITTQSGDRLSGRVVNTTAELIELETPYAGRISIRVKQIKSWQTSDETLRRQLGAVLPLATPATAPAKQAETKLAANTVSANKVEPKKPASVVATTNKGPQWQRTINLAYTFSRGNTNINDLNTALGLARKHGQQRFVFNGLGRYSVRNGAQIAHLLSSTFRYENMLNKLPTFSETIFEIDRIKRLDYRFSENLGVTYPALKRETQQLSLDFGTGVTREVYNNGQQRTIATSLLRAKAEQKLNGKAQLSQQVSLFSDLLDPENYRMQTDVSLTMPITKYLGFRLAGLNRFDNRPAAVNIKQSDFSLLTGFNINF